MKHIISELKTLKYLGLVTSFWDNPKREMIILKGDVLYHLNLKKTKTNHKTKKIEKLTCIEFLFFCIIHTTAAQGYAGTIKRNIT